MDLNNGEYWSNGGNQRVMTLVHKRFLLLMFQQSQALEKARRHANGVPKTRTKGVPQNFGYIKRSNGSSTATEMQTNAMINGGRTAHVSAVPRSNKLKVSGGTQTANGDFQQSKKTKLFKKFPFVNN